MKQIAADLDEIWARRLASDRPGAPVILEGPPLAAVGTFVVPAKKTVVAPPDKSGVEKIANSDIVIVRDPDGRVTLTNRPDKAKE
jgi:hypothetical protein